MHQLPAYMDRNQRRLARRAHARREPEIVDDDCDAPSTRRFLKIFGGVVGCGGALVLLLMANSPQVEPPMSAAQKRQLARYERHVASWVSYRDSECLPVPMDADVPGAAPRVVWACPGNTMYEEGRGGVPSTWTGAPAPSSAPADAGMFNGMVPAGEI